MHLPLIDDSGRDQCEATRIVSELGGVDALVEVLSRAKTDEHGGDAPLLAAAAAVGDATWVEAVARVRGLGLDVEMRALLTS